MTTWFYQYNGKPIGPIPETQMQEWVQQKALRPTQLVRKDRATEWQKAGSCRELFAEGFDEDGTAEIGAGNFPATSFVVITDIKAPFWSMVVLLVKWAIAAILVTIIPLIVWVIMREMLLGKVRF